MVKWINGSCYCLNCFIVIFGAEIFLIMCRNWDLKWTQGLLVEGLVINLDVAGADGIFGV